MAGLKDIAQLLKSEKAIRFAFIIGIALVLVTALSGLFSGRTQVSGQQNDISSEEHVLEQRLERILGEIDGVGKLSVMVTLDCGEQTEYTGTKDMPHTVKTPQVRGVIVVCDGGNNIVVREKVITAVSGVFGLSTARISVTK